MRSGGVGYLLKDRVANVGDFLDAITRVAGLPRVIIVRRDALGGGGLGKTGPHDRQGH
jgi:hypothetical protein